MYYIFSPLVWVSRYLKLTRSQNIFSRRDDPFGILESTETSTHSYDNGLSLLLRIPQHPFSIMLVQNIFTAVKCLILRKFSIFPRVNGLREVYYCIYMYRYSIWLQYSINSKTNESFLVTQLLIYQHPLFLFQDYMILPTILHYHSRVPHWFPIRRTYVKMFLESCGKMYRYHFLSYPINRTFHLSSKFSVI